jgi:hypothetical protein
VDSAASFSSLIDRHWTQTAAQSSGIGAVESPPAPPFMTLFMKGSRKRLLYAIDPIQCKLVPAIPRAMTNGVLYVSSADDRRQLLFDSLVTIKRFEPEIPIYAISDVPLDVPFLWVHRRPGSASIYKSKMLELSPYDCSLYLSDEMRLTDSVGSIDSILGDCDLAMTRDPRHPTLGRLIANGDAMQMFSPEERAAMHKLGSDGPEVPYLSTNVIFLRKTPNARLLFAAWQEEWLRFEHQEQAALARALHRCTARVRILPEEFNYIPANVPATTADSKPKKIVHFTSLDLRSIPPLAPPHRTFSAFNQAVQHGLCTGDQYEMLGRLILNLRPISLLIFGCGADSEFWASLNTGQTRFVESNQKYADIATNAGLDVVRHSFPTRRGQPASPEHKSLPLFMRDRTWDLVFIDGPPGYALDQPGRELPISWASQLQTQPIIVMHDFERSWERFCADRYIGAPDLWLAGTPHRPQEMAFWLRNRIKPGAILP